MLFIIIFLGGKVVEIEGWSVITNKEGKEALKKDFLFKDFIEAFEFMKAVAIKAEAICHHPEWFNVYNKVFVELTTHDTGGVSEKDYEMAEFMDEKARR